MVYSSTHPLVTAIHQHLLPHLQIESVDPDHPVVVHVLPQPWEHVGAGNYAAVFGHPDYPTLVIKIYAPDRPGWDEEVEVYHRLGEHPCFSQCFYAEKPFLVLKRLHGTTLYDCLHQGRYIPEQVIVDIDKALEDARLRGLHPHDVHGRNVMMHEGRGIVVDISDFLKSDDCLAWNDLKRGYYWVYRPLFSWLKLRVPYSWLDALRAVYRFYRRHIIRRR
ncbi:MAG: serine/threonine protein kinase [Cyanobacteria bacterium J06627_8]